MFIKFAKISQFYVEFIPVNCLTIYKKSMIRDKSEIPININSLSFNINDWV